MENDFSRPNNGIGLGIAGLVLGIIALPFALMGCTSVAALLMATLGVAFSTVALSQARKVAAPNSLIMAALIISIIALCFSVLKVTNSVMKIKQFPWETVNRNIDIIEEEANAFGDSFEEEFERELGGNLEEVLRDLEDEFDESFDDFDESFDDFDESFDDFEEEFEDIGNKEEAARRLGRAAGRALKEFVDEINDSTDIKIVIEKD